jgi:hypothetical protein
MEIEPGNQTYQKIKAIGPEGSFKKIRVEMPIITDDQPRMRRMLGGVSRVYSTKIKTNHVFRFYVENGV